MQVVTYQGVWPHARKWLRTECSGRTHASGYALKRPQRLRAKMETNGAFLTSIFLRDRPGFAMRAHPINRGGGRVVGQAPAEDAPSGHSALGQQCPLGGGQGENAPELKDTGHKYPERA